MNYNDWTYCAQIIGGQLLDTGGSGMNFMVFNVFFFLGRETGGLLT